MALSVVTPAAKASATLSILLRFDGTTERFPFGTLLLGRNGKLYGTTAGSTALSNFASGTLYELDRGTAARHVLATFYDSSIGVGPRSRMVEDVAGNLYGVCDTGGPGTGTSYNRGTVYRLTAGTNALDRLGSFGPVTGAAPVGAVYVDANRNVYGTTSQGGLFERGTLFRIDAATHLLVTLVTFAGPNGGRPFGDLIADAAGNLYGTTKFGGANDQGTVFRFVPATNTLTTLASFDGTNGARPEAGLTFDAAGNLYGSTTAGGTDDGGVVFELAAGANAIVALGSFDGSNGALPRGTVLVDAAGDLYGTCYQGGAGSRGTVYKLTRATGALDALVTFNNANGAFPVAGLTSDGTGDLYGTTAGGGIDNAGTLFRLTGSGFVVPEPATALAALAGARLGGRRRRGRPSPAVVS